MRLRISVVFFEGVDVRRVANGMGRDPRIGRAFLDAGLGFGGPCLPKDLRALVMGAQRKGIRMRLAEAVLLSNEIQPLRAVHLAHRIIGNLRGKKAAVLGLAFKAGTSDMREAPSVKLVHALLREAMHVTVYDPEAMQDASAYFGKKVEYAGLLLRRDRVGHL